MQPPPPVDSRTGHESPDRRLILGISLFLWIVTYVLYLPTAQFDFVSFDDPLFVTHNEHVNKGFTGAGIYWAFTSAEIDYWRPLSWLSHMLDVELFGLAAGSHHQTNVVIHSFNAVLLFFVFLQMRLGLPGAYLIAALFAWHPLHVESVAWIAERKDVLCAFFWFLALLSHARYAQTGKKRFYGITLTAFALGLMSKPMIVTLPFQLLLLDFWPLKRPIDNSRWKSLLIEKTPFLGLTLLSSIFAYTAQVSVGEMAAGTVPDVGFRIGNALIAYSDYLQHTIWPSGLGVFYPYPESLPTTELAIAALLLFSATYLAFVYLRDKPFILVGWLFFLGTIVPVVGILKVGGQASADRYTYVATTGLFWILAAVLFPAGKPMRRPSLIIAGAVLILTLVSSRQQIRHWRNNIALFSHTIAVTENNWVMMNNLARAYLTEGDTIAAREWYEEALKIRPVKFAHFFLGQIHHRESRAAEAEANYLATLELDSRFAPANNLLGELYLETGRTKEAMIQFRRVLEINPEDENARSRLQHLSVPTAPTSTTQ